MLSKWLEKCKFSKGIDKVDNPNYIHYQNNLIYIYITKNIIYLNYHYKLNNQMMLFNKFNKDNHIFNKQHPHYQNIHLNIDNFEVNFYKNLMGNLNKYQLHHYKSNISTHIFSNLYQCHYYNIRQNNHNQEFLKFYTIHTYIIDIMLNKFCKSHNLQNIHHNYNY